MRYRTSYYMKANVPYRQTTDVDLLVNDNISKNVTSDLSCNEMTISLLTQNVIMKYKYPDRYYF